MAGDRDSGGGQPDPARTADPHRPPRDTVRHPLPRPGPVLLRDSWSPRPDPAPSPGGLWMVRDRVVDRRRGDLHPPSRVHQAILLSADPTCAVARDVATRVRLLSRILGGSAGHCLERHGRDKSAGEVLGADTDLPHLLPPGLGLRQVRRPPPHAVAVVEAVDVAVLGPLLPFPHREHKLLGHPGPQHSRLHQVWIKIVGPIMNNILIFFIIIYYNLIIFPVQLLHN